MGLVILEIDDYDAKDLAAWDWAELLAESADKIRVNAFDTAEELRAAVASS